MLGPSRPDEMGATDAAEDRALDRFLGASLRIPTKAATHFDLIAAAIPI